MKSNLWQVATGTVLGAALGFFGGYYLHFRSPIAPLKWEVEAFWGSTDDDAGSNARALGDRYAIYMARADVDGDGVYDLKAHSYARCITPERMDVALEAFGEKVSVGARLLSNKAPIDYVARPDILNHYGSSLSSLEGFNMKDYTTVDQQSFDDSMGYAVNRFGSRFIH